MGLDKVFHNADFKGDGTPTSPLRIRVYPKWKSSLEFQNVLGFERVVAASMLDSIQLDNGDGQYTRQLGDTVTDEKGVLGYIKSESEMEGYGVTYNIVVQSCFRYYLHL
jgi:hypothetical protein